METDRIGIQVAIAERGRQTVRDLVVPAGCTAREAVERSGVLAGHPEVDVSKCAYGVFGRGVEPDQVLQHGDRVEVLRPLLHDPRERRRRLAKQGRTMGRGSAGGS